MTRCACGRPRPLNLPIVGIQRDYNDVPSLILFNCVCKTTRSLPWTEATTQQRFEASLAEKSRLAMEGLI
jgi:hypothetical protein